MTIRSHKVVYLHPPGAQESWANAVSCALQVGAICAKGRTRASLWSGSASSFRRLRGAHAIALCLHNNLVGGVLDEPYKPRPWLWRLTNSEGQTRLLPNSIGHVNGIYNDLLVGVSVVDGRCHATAWREDGKTLDLHPSWAIFSEAFAISKKQIVGMAQTDKGERAVVWSTRNAAVRSLHPDCAIYSVARGVHDDQQVGYAYVDGLYRASLWTGHKNSLKILNPYKHLGAEAVCVHSGWQGGYVKIDDERRAALWRGTKDSYMDLHELLDSKFGSSYVSGVWSGGSTVLATGAGYKKGRSEALLWVLEF